jgi:hypothetical protein
MEDRVVELRNEMQSVRRRKYTHHSHHNITIGGLRSGYSVVVWSLKSRGCADLPNFRSTIDMLALLYCTVHHGGSSAE